MDHMEPNNSANFEIPSEHAKLDLKDPAFELWSRKIRHSSRSLTLQDRSNQKGCNYSIRSPEHVIPDPHTEIPGCNLTI